MTVVELIEALRQMPPDAEVYTHGYEMGLLPMNHVRLATIALADLEPDDESWWRGSHDEAEGGTQSVVLEHEGMRSNSSEG